MLYTRGCLRHLGRKHEQRPSGATGVKRSARVRCSGGIGEIPRFPYGRRTPNPNVFTPKGQLFRSFLYNVRSEDGRRISDASLKRFSSRFRARVPMRDDRLHGLLLDPQPSLTFPYIAPELPDLRIHFALALQQCFTVQVFSVGLA